MGSQSILIADDDDVVLDVCSSCLEESGYNVLCAKNAKSAFSIIENNDLDLLITDVYMNDVNGVVLMVHCAQYFPNMPIIIVTSDESIKCQEALFSKYNLKEVIVKPIDTNALVSSVKSIFTK